MDELPSHWELSKVYGSANQAIRGLARNDEKFELHEVDTEKTPQEWIEVEQLMQRTWHSDKVGIGKDARNLDHNAIEVVKIERVENPTKIRDYNIKRLKLVEDGKYFREVEILPGSSGPVETARHLKQDGFLCQQVHSPMNEHYLFHGTKEDNVFIIQRDGLDNRFGNRNSLLGPGIYMAESSTKADQYTDMKTDRTDEDFQKMFLVRVLLGDIFLNKDKSPPKFERPPCKKCLEVKCQCVGAVHFDSIVDDAGRLFREFVVYDSSQCYPEYLITYRRVKPGQATTSPQPPTKQVPTFPQPPTTQVTTSPQPPTTQVTTSPQPPTTQVTTSPQPPTTQFTPAQQSRAQRWAELYRRERIVEHLERQLLARRFGFRGNAASNEQGVYSVDQSGAARPGQSTSTPNIPVHNPNPRSLFPLVPQASTAAGQFQVPISTIPQSSAQSSTPPTAGNSTPRQNTKMQNWAACTVVLLFLAVFGNMLYLIIEGAIDNCQYRGYAYGVGILWFFVLCTLPCAGNKCGQFMFSIVMMLTGGFSMRGTVFVASDADAHCGKNMFYSLIISSGLWAAFVIAGIFMVCCCKKDPNSEAPASSMVTHA